MGYYTYIVRRRPAQSGQVEHMAQASVPDGAWQAAAALIAGETSVLTRSAEKMKTRWQNNQAAIAISEQQEIVAYVALAPSLASPTRQKLNEYLGLYLPQPDVYAGVTGWTHPDWRRLGLARAIRTPLYGQYTEHQQLVIVSTIGMGGSPVVSGMGFRLLGWDTVPFLSSLEGWYRPGEAYIIGDDYWQVYPGIEPYNGSHITPRTHPDHEWHRYFHFWVSDEVIACQLDADLTQVLGGNLDLWRRAIAAQTDK